jgi:ribosome biogenesis GTPase
MELQQLHRARVTFAAQERYRVSAGGLECEAVPTGSLRWDGELPAVGDWVEARMAGPEFAVIERVLPRTATISRRQPGRAHDQQTLAANVDLIVLVTALDRDFNLRRLERYLVLAAESGAASLIALNKAELCEDTEARVEEIRAIAPDTPCVALSAIESVDPLLGYIGWRTVVLLGSSGVGKSTIVNGLLGESRQATREVRTHDSRGQHTTTHRMLIPLPGGGALIDTPGLRELALWAGQPALDEAFADIAALAAQCRFRDCRHAGEPGCAVAGTVDPARWASYLKLQSEIRYHERATDLQAALAVKRQWKSIHKEMRKHPKYRR